MPIIDIEYVHRNSPVHRMHPAVLVVFELSVFAIAASFNHPAYLAVLIAAILVVVRVAGIPLRKLRYMWVTVAVAAVFVATQGVWFTSFGEFAESGREATTLFYLWPSWLPTGPRVAFTLEGAVFGLSLGMRFVAIALAFPLLVMTVHPRDLVTFLAGLRIFGRRIPYSVIFVLTNALRYVPTISAQFDETVDAQRARGVEFDRGGPTRRARAAGSLLIPVLTASLVHARDLTLALESRGFGADTERTFMRSVNFRLPVDAVFIALLVIAAVVCSWLAGVNEVGMLPYTPGLMD